MNIYVSNLGFNVTEDELKKMFTQFGEVSSTKVVTDYNTGSSRGFAFVDMPNDQEAQKAIKELNETDLSGRKLSVQTARPKEDRPKRSSDNNSYKRF